MFNPFRRTEELGGAQQRRVAEAEFIRDGLTETTNNLGSMNPHLAKELGEEFQTVRTHRAELENRIKQGEENLKEEAQKLLFKGQEIQAAFFSAGATMPKKYMEPLPEVLH